MPSDTGQTGVLHQIELTTIACFVNCHIACTWFNWNRLWVGIEEYSAKLLWFPVIAATWIGRYPSPPSFRTVSGDAPTRNDKYPTKLWNPTHSFCSHRKKKWVYPHIHISDGLIQVKHRKGAGLSLRWCSRVHRQYALGLAHLHQWVARMMGWSQRGTGQFQRDCWCSGETKKRVYRCAFYIFVGSYQSLGIGIENKILTTPTSIFVDLDRW